MITARRRAHRRIHQALWPVLALLFAAILFDRRPIDPREDWTALLARSARPLAADAPDWSSLDAFGSWPARLTLFADGSVEIRPLRPLDRPELLVYWIPGEPPGDRLPDSAHLLGRLTGTHAQRFRLPTATATTTATATAPPNDRGTVVVYSLGHDEIVATARVAPAEARP